LQYSDVYIAFSPAKEKRDRIIKLMKTYEEGLEGIPTAVNEELMQKYGLKKF
jgi:hypothetical protein